MRRVWLWLVPLAALVTAAHASAAPTATPSGFSLTAIPGLTGADFSGIAGPAAHQTWVVGSQAKDSRRFPLVERWNDQRWTRIAVPPPPGTTTFWLQDVAATSQSDVWVDGGGRAGTRNLTFLSRWNGSRWVRLGLPRSFGPIARVSDLAVGGPKDVWIVGNGGCTQLDALATVLHWNGEDWTSVWGDIPCSSNGDEEPIRSLFSSAPGTVWRLGAIFSHEDNGVPWWDTECVGADCPPYYPNACIQYVDSFGGVGDAADMWLVGYVDPADDTGSPLGEAQQPWVCHYSHGACTDESPPFVYPTQHELTSATVLADGTLWTVGSRIATGGQRSLILRRSTDGSWSDLGGPNPAGGGAIYSTSLPGIAHVPDTASEM